MAKKRILCYGDSNTWGTIPRWIESNVPSERYDKNTRWTGRIQTILGDGYEIIEEGLGGRTTIYEPEDAPWKCGKNYLVPCLMSHRQLDLVVIMLGTNDLHQKNIKMEEKNLGNGIRELIELIQASKKAGAGYVAPKILVIAPAEIKPSAPRGRVKVYSEFYGDWGRHLSQMFPQVYEQVAKENDCYFLNGALYAEPSDGDGVHFMAESHLRLGDAVAEKIKEIFEA